MKERGKCLRGEKGKEEWCGPPAKNWGVVADRTLHTSVGPVGRFVLLLLRRRRRPRLVLGGRLKKLTIPSSWDMQGIRTQKNNTGKKERRLLCLNELGYT